MTILYVVLVGFLLAFGFAWLSRFLLSRLTSGRRAGTFRDMPLTASFGLGIIGLYAFVALFAPLIAPFGEKEIVGAQYLPWATPYLLGTDSLGRDMLSRLIFGARNTVAIAFVTSVLAFAVGSFFGIWAAIVGGWFDQALSRFVDAVMAIPALIFSLLLLTIFGTSITTLILIIAAVDATRVFRLSRAVAQNIVVLDYIEAARLRGEGLIRLMWREILPNALTPLIAEFGLRFCFVFLSIAALSFLGLGIKPPTADWGSMVRESAKLITFGDVTPLLPAAAIALLTISINFVVDWQLQRTSSREE